MTADILPPDPPVVLFAGPEDARAAYAEPLGKAAERAHLALDLRMDPADAEAGEVDYLIFAANGPVRAFDGFTRLKGILSLWAGVDGILKLDPPHDVPLVRMVEDGMTLGMVDYVMGHVLRHHLDIDRYIDAEPVAVWEKDHPPLACSRHVGVLGLGALGAACAQALSRHGFDVSGWSRSRKEIPGVTCRDGDEGLEQVIGEAEILVLLLPHTPDTERLIDADRIARMPEGAVLVNPARGPLIDHDALLAALDAGRLRHATMDVFDEEPLPEEHPYWRHPRVTVTPHIASATRPETAAEALVGQIARAERGEPFAHVVDRGRGY
ncbi:MAG TPA: glyoxylate/hydroxypyruvate reductase A [Thermohalobaculum sp.]|nr:glyoxylate/hydroxypyruvate reductase A [Thermohalobaculum sp.]